MSRAHQEAKCLYCGSSLIFDSATHSYVCPVCGVVYDYEMIPSYQQIMYSAPLASDRFKLDKEVVSRAQKLFEKYVAKDFANIEEPYAHEMKEILGGVVIKREYRLPWSAIKKYREVAQKSVQVAGLEEEREKRVQEEIKKFVEEQNLGIDYREVWFFAVRYKRLWAGRKAATIARIFTYLYCKKRLNKEIKIDARSSRIARALEKVLEYE